MSDANSDFVNWVERYAVWYDTASGRWSFLLNACKVVSFLASFVSIIVAAAVDKEFFAGEGRWIIVAASLMAAASSEILAQMKVREKEDLPEVGRIEAEYIAANARLAVAELASDPASLSKAKSEIIERLRVLELKQHRGDFELGAPPAPPAVAPDTAIR